MTFASRAPGPGVCGLGPTLHWNMALLWHDNRGWGPRGGRPLIPHGTAVSQLRYCDLDRYTYVAAAVVSEGRTSSVLAIRHAEGSVFAVVLELEPLVAPTRVL